MFQRKNHFINKRLQKPRRLNMKCIPAVNSVNKTNRNRYNSQSWKFYVKFFIANCNSYCCSPCTMPSGNFWCKLGTGCKDTLVICNSAFMALVIWNYFKTVLIWKIFNPNYDFLVLLCLYLVQKYEKNAVANDKCVFATSTEFRYKLLQNQKSTNSAFYVPRKYNRQRRRLLFLLCPQVSEKSGVMKENCWTVVLVVVHRVFYSHFIISVKKYDMVLVAKTFFYIFCFVSTVQCQILAGGWANPKKLNFF
jgi:hypothetical protein